MLVAVCGECKKELEVLAFHPTRRKLKFCSFKCGKEYLTKRPAGKMTAKEKKRIAEEKALEVGGGLGVF